MEKPQNIKGIFLDLGYTLLYPPSGSFMFSQFARQHFSSQKLSRLPKERVSSAMQAARVNLEGDPLVLSMEKEYQVFYKYYAALSEALGLDLSEEELSAVTEDKVYNKLDNYRLYEDSISTLQALRGRYKLGIISDTWPSIVPVLEALDILKYFDCRTFSFELGCLKPDRRMYQDALQKMGLPPENTLFVDDNPKNVQSAATLGILPVQITAAGPGPVIDRIYAIDGIQAAGGPNSGGSANVTAPIEAPDGGFVIDRISGLLDILD